MQLKRSLLYLWVCFLTACEIGYPPPTHPGIGFPPPPPPALSSEYDYSHMAPEKRDEIIKVLIEYYVLYGSYLKGVVMTYQGRVFITGNDKHLLCRPEHFLKQVELPPSLKLKDDGKHTDDEIIGILARYIKVLRSSVEAHNRNVEKIAADFERNCISTTQ